MVSLLSIIYNTNFNYFSFFLVVFSDILGFSPTDYDVMRP